MLEFFPYDVHMNFNCRINFYHFYISLPVFTVAQYLCYREAEIITIIMKNKLGKIAIICVHQSLLCVCICVYLMKQ